MYYYLGMLVAALVLVTITTIISINRVHKMKSYRDTIKQFNEIHLELEQQMMEDSFNIGDTVYVIDEGFIEQGILSGIYEDEDGVVFDIEFDCGCIKTFSPIVVFLDQVELMDYYNTQFLNILDDMEDEDEEKPTGGEKTTKLKK